MSFVCRVKGWLLYVLYKYSVDFLPAIRLRQLISGTKFWINLELPELDKIQTIKELLYAEYGLISLALFDVFFWLILC